MLFAVSLLCLVLTGRCQRVETVAPPNNILVFEGTLEKLAPDVGILSGGIAVYRLAKYRIETICQGDYDEKEIVVDHLILSGNEFADIKIGDRVCVTVQVADKVLARYNADGIRSPSDVIKTFYVGVDGVTRSHQDSNCCHAPR
jgi:hypothetical protein